MDSLQSGSSNDRLNEKHTTWPRILKNCNWKMDFLYVKFLKRIISYRCQIKQPLNPVAKNFKFKANEFYIILFIFYHCNFSINTCIQWIKKMIKWVTFRCSSWFFCIFNTSCRCQRFICSLSSGHVEWWENHHNNKIVEHHQDY